MAEVRCDVFIDAPPSAVWAVLADVGSWSDWNDVMFDASGGGSVGEMFTLRVDVGPLAVSVKAPIHRWEAEAELSWRARIIPMFDVYHALQLSAEGEGTRFVHLETFDGMVGGLAVMFGGASLTQRYKDFNQALKRRVEAG